MISPASVWCVTTRRMWSLPYSAASADGSSSASAPIGIVSPSIAAGPSPSRSRKIVQAGSPSSSTIRLPRAFVMVIGWPVAMKPWLAWVSNSSVGSQMPTANAACWNRSPSMAWNVATPCIWSELVAPKITTSGPSTDSMPSMMRSLAMSMPEASR